MVVNMAGFEFDFPLISIASDFLEQSLQEQKLTDYQDRKVNILFQALTTGNDVEIIKAFCSCSISSILTIVARRHVTHSRNRMIILGIIKEAILKNDDKSICRWYSKELSSESTPFTAAELIKIDQALRLQAKLIEFRENIKLNLPQQTLSITYESNLIHSNIFELSDKIQLEKLSRESKFKNSSKIKETEEGKKYTSDALEEEQIGNLWLDSKVTSEFVNNSRYFETINKIGYISRIEKALNVKDGNQIKRLLSTGQKYHRFIEYNLRLRIESLLDIESFTAIFRSNN
jgi:hypothetical protein